MSTNRVRWADISKGIAIIAIILGHCGIARFNRVVYTFHVPVFYAISGYFLKPNTVGMHTFIQRKAKQLLLPYGITCLIICLLSVPINIIENKSWLVDLKRWIIASIYGSGLPVQTPFTVPHIGAIWFLLALFWGVVLCYYVLQDYKKRIFLIMITCYFSFLSATYFWLPFSIQAGCISTLFILLGYFLKKINWSERISTPLTICMFVIWGISIYTYKDIGFVNCSFGNGIIDIISCALAVLCIFKIALFIEKNFKLLGIVLSFLGENSLFVLCLHLIEINLLNVESLVFKLSFPIIGTVLIVLLKKARNKGKCLII